MVIAVVTERSFESDDMTDPTITLVGSSRNGSEKNKSDFFKHKKRGALCHRKKESSDITNRRNTWNDD
jgi:hypothetical protein